METFKVRSLSETERASIGEALSAFIASYPPESKKTWSHRIILKEMLDDLAWAQPERRQP